MSLGRWAPLLLGLLGLLPLCGAQMESPLKGSGLPALETTDIYVSAYLDRLLSVDEDNYRWEAVLYFYISWTDPNAFSTVVANTLKMMNNTFDCKSHCSSLNEKVLCCDDVFLPTFSFKNAYGFPQDRAVMYNIYPAPDGSVLREVRVHGLFYQPMDFRHFPFDSMDMLVDLRFWDPTILFDTAVIYDGKEHKGLTVHPSSGGSKLFTYGKGDDASSWAVTDFAIESYSVDFGMWFNEFSERQSHPEDPMPLAPVNAEQAGSVDENGVPLNVFTGVSDQLLAVLITVERFWKPSLINAVLPVVLVYFLGMFVFFCDESDLPTRLEIVVTLFLALAAVQFVVSGSVPTSSYVVPTQQLVLTTYVFLFILALESITVYHIVRRHHKREAGRTRREAYRRYCKLRNQGRLEGGKNLPLSAADSALLPTLSQDSTLPKDVSQHGAAAAQAAAGVANGEQGPAGSAAAAEVAGQQQRRLPFGLCFHAAKGQDEGPASRRPAERLTSFKHMTADEAYGQYVGHWVDNVAAVFMGVAYLVTCTLIFTLQKGYINVFE